MTTALPDDPSFLALPGQVADWRAVLLTDTAVDAGVLEALPATAEEVAARTASDPRAVQVVLDALTVFDVVVRADDGSYARGPAAPDAGTAAVLHQHAGVIARWGATVGARLRGELPAAYSPRPRAELARWLDSLSDRAQTRAAELADACLAATPGAKTVLDLGGGHGEYGLEFARRGLTVTMQDQPAVIDIAYERGRLEAGGVILFASDFFEALPDGPFDLVLLAGVAHTLPTDRLGVLYQRIRPLTGSALAVSTFLRNTDSVSPLFAIQMLTVGSGADTHSEDEHRDLLGAAGFGAVRTLPLHDDGPKLLVAAAR